MRKKCKVSAFFPLSFTVIVSEHIWRGIGAFCNHVSRLIILPAVRFFSGLLSKNWTLWGAPVRTATLICTRKSFEFDDKFAETLLFEV
jgi:hypothetical protein